MFHQKQPEGCFINSRISGKHAIRWLAAAATAVFATALLIDAPAVSEGIKKGLMISAGVLIPSLFPFMVLCGFISMTNFSRELSLPLGWFTQKIYKLPKEMGAVILMSMVGGFPAGARMISESLARKRISIETASRMLCFCVNAGPSFLITAVGTGMFLSRTAGLIMFGVQTGVTLLTGALFSLRHENIREDKAEAPPVNTVPAFVMSVTGASSSMISLCAFAIFFSGVLELVNSSGIIIWISELVNVDKQIIKAVINGFFEVTSGCLSSAGLGGTAGFAMASAMISFGGISVIFQIASFFRDNPVNLKPFLLSRLVHMLLSAPAAAILFSKFCAVENVWVSAPPPGMQADSRTFIISACLIGMCTILVLSASGKSSLSHSTGIDSVKENRDNYVKSIRK